MLATAPCLGQAGSAQPAADPARETVQNTEPIPESALAAAERVVRAYRADPGAGEAELARVLKDPQTSDVALSGLADMERLPVTLWRPVSTCTTDEYPAPTRLLAVRVLPRFGSRDAATRLLALLDDPAQPVAQAARVALTDMTGLGDGWKVEQWRAWGADAATWSDRAWTNAITTRLAAKSRALADRQRALGDEVVSLYRRLHVELDAAGRTTLLTELLRDERPALLDLGFDLAGRDLSARTQLGPEVAVAASARLSHADPTIRAKAATLVTRLVPPDAMLTLTRALQSERVAAAAEPMLLGVARWPNEAALLPTIAWLERDDAPLGAVSTALWSMAQAELLNDPTLRERVLTTLRGRDAARGGEPALKLLMRFGDADDLARVAALLASPEDPVRNAAAVALAETPAGATVLIDAAASEPRLFAPAARAITTHLPTPEGLRKLVSLPVIDPAARDAALVDMARRIRPDELSAAVLLSGLPDALREPVLARLAEPDRERTPGVLDGLLLLAETRVNLTRPTQALVVLKDVDTTVLGETQVRVWTRLTLLASVMTGDVDGAAALAGLALDDWMTAWRHLPAESASRGPIADLIAARFATALSDAHRTELGLGPATLPPATPSDPADASPPSDGG